MFDELAAPSEYAPVWCACVTGGDRDRPNLWQCLRCDVGRFTDQERTLMLDGPAESWAWCAACRTTLRR